MNERKIGFGILSTILCALMVGCSLIKNNSSNKGQWSNERYNSGMVNSLEHKQNWAETQYMAFNTDSASSAYLIKLWPKGKISFNNATGFEGEFDSVQMRGSTKNIAQSNKLIRNSSDEQHHKSVDVKLENSEKTDVKTVEKSSNPNYLVICMVTSLFLIGIYFLLKRIKF
jgi:hypothetical protein